MRDGTRVQVVGIVEDGKYGNLIEDPKPAMFVPLLQSPSTEIWLVVRSNSDPQQLTSAIKSKLRDLDEGLPIFIETWNQGLSLPLFPSRVATVSLCVLGLMGAMLSITGIFGMAAYSVSKRMRELGIRMALGAQPSRCCRQHWDAPSNCSLTVRLQDYSSEFLRLLSSLPSYIRPLPATRSSWPASSSPCPCSASSLPWIPAQRALSIEPLILLREE